MQKSKGRMRSYINESRTRSRRWASLEHVMLSERSQTRTAAWQACVMPFAGPASPQARRHTRRVRSWRALGGGGWRVTI